MEVITISKKKKKAFAIYNIREQREDRGTGQMGQREREKEILS